MANNIAFPSSVLDADLTYFAKSLIDDECDEEGISSQSSELAEAISRSNLFQGDAGSASCNQADVSPTLTAKTDQNKMMDLDGVSFLPDVKALYKSETNANETITSGFNKIQGTDTGTDTVASSTCNELVKTELKDFQGSYEKPGIASDIEMIYLPGSNQRRYKCVQCTYVARTSGLVKQHQALHSNVKPYVCNMCGFATKWPTSLRIHKCSNVTKRGRGAARAQNFPFTRLSSDKRSHLNTGLAYGSAPPPTSTVSLLSSQGPPVTDLGDIKPKIYEMASDETYKLYRYNCPHCSYGSNAKQAFESHMTVHNDEKPFGCYSCDFKTKWRTSLKYHMAHTHGIVNGLGTGSSGPGPGETTYPASSAPFPPSSQNIFSNVVSQHPLAVPVSFTDIQNVSVASNLTNQNLESAAAVNSDNNAKILASILRNHFLLMTCKMCSFATDDCTNIVRHMTQAHSSFLEADLQLSGIGIPPAMNVMDPPASAPSYSTLTASDTTTASLPHLTDRTFSTTTKVNYRTDGRIRLPLAKDNTCHDCKKVFSSRQVYIAHMHRHEGRRYNCQLCSFQTGWYSSFRRHKRHVHGKVPYPYTSSGRSVDHNVTADDKVMLKRNNSKPIDLSSSGDIETWHQTSGKESQLDFSKHVDNVEFGRLKQHNGKKFRCWLRHCRFSTRLKFSLRHHIRQHFPLKKKLICKHCTWTTTSKFSELIHSKKHFSLPRFQCNVEGCEFSTQWFHKFERHEMLQNHDGLPDENKHPRPPYKCLECSLSFDTRLSLAEHYSVHAVRRVFQCDKSGCSFRTKFEGVSERQRTAEVSANDSNSKSSPQSENYECASLTSPVGQSAEQSQQDLLVPVTIASQTRHDRRPSMYVCKKCGFSTKWRSSFKNHVAVHSGMRKYKCNQCDYAAVLRSQLRTHLQKHASPDNWTCREPGCHYQTRWIDTFKRHQLRHRGLDRYQCSFCTYSTSCSTSLKYHLRCHSDRRPYLCSYCDFSTKWENSLRLHHNSHHPDKPKPFPAAAQSTDFIDEKNITQQTENSPAAVSAVAVPVPISASGQFAGQTLGLSVPLPSLSVNDSMSKLVTAGAAALSSTVQETPPVPISTAGIIPLAVPASRTPRKDSVTEFYYCQQCDYKTRFKPTLTVHLRKHSNERPYKCTLCDFSTKWAHSLRNHSRTVHRYILNDKHVTQSC